MPKCGFSIQIVGFLQKKIDFSLHKSQKLMSLQAKNHQKSNIN